jgi:biopolymer transport protein ExbD
VLVSVSRQGALFFNNRQVTDAKLRDHLLEAARANPETPVVLRGDSGIPYGELIRVLDLVRGSGLTNIGLATRSPGG